MLIGFILLVVLAALAPVGVTNCSNPELFLEVEGGVALFLVLVLGGIIYKKYELLIEIEQKNEAQPLRDEYEISHESNQDDTEHDEAEVIACRRKCRGKSLSARIGQ